MLKKTNPLDEKASGFKDPLVGARPACYLRLKMFGVCEIRSTFCVTFCSVAIGHRKMLEAEDKTEFVKIFGELLEHTYMDKTSQYSGEKIEYLEEKIDGKYGVVKAIVITKDKKEVAVDYRIKNKSGEWFVYDLNVEGVSLVKNYRIQFNSIIMKSSFDELKKRLYAKVEENQKE